MNLNRFVHGEQIIIELWPSIFEIKESSLEDTYPKSLTEYYRSIRELIREGEKNGNPLEIYEGWGYTKGRRIARNEPPLIVEITTFILPAIALGVFKLLQLWVNFKNGRKLKIKYKDFELESSQLTETQFLSLLRLLDEERLLDKEKEKPQEKLYSNHDFLKKLSIEGIIFRELSSEDRNKQLAELQLERRKRNREFYEN